MRALINGLVGGPELLVQWEHAWREQNGGEELDYASDGDADEEDGSDEEDEKPKKKAKVVADGPKAVAIPSVPAVGASAAQPDLKRKRGRPRKNPLPAVLVPAPPPMHSHLVQQQYEQQQQGGGKYLLGVFLLFTFLNPSSTPSSPSHPHTHTGSVLTPHVNAVLNSDRARAVLSHPASQFVASYVPANGIFNLSWGVLVQYAYGITTLLLFLSVARSLMPQRTRHSSEADTPSGENPTLKGALEKDDRVMLGDALGCSNIRLYCATRAAASALWKSSLRALGLKVQQYDSTTRAAVVRLAELDLIQSQLKFWLVQRSASDAFQLIGDHLPVSRRLYHTARLSEVLITSPSTSELTTLTMLSHTLPLSISSSSWSAIQSTPISRDKSFLIDRTLDDAVRLYQAGLAILGARSGAVGNDTEDGRITPLGLIASGYACERIRDVASELFANESPCGEDDSEDNVRTPVPVSWAGEPPQSSYLSHRGNASGSGPSDASSSSAQEEAEAKRTEELEDLLTLGHSLTKPIRELTSLLSSTITNVQPLSRGVTFVLDDEDEDSERDALGDANAFLEAILLYRRISESEKSSASPSPSETSTLFAGDRQQSFSSGSSSFGSSDSGSGPGTPADLDSEDSVSVVTNGTITHGAVTGYGVGAGAGKASVGTRLALRRILGTKAFSGPLEIEDARNRMVDYLVDTVW